MSRMERLRQLDRMLVEARAKGEPLDAIQSERAKLITAGHPSIDPRPIRKLIGDFQD